MSAISSVHEIHEERLQQLRWYDREALSKRHQPLRTEWRNVWDESTSSVIEKAIPCEPYCGGCREPWGEGGCRIHRALLWLSIHERARHELARRVSALEEALAPRFGVEKLRDRQNPWIELRMRIDRYSLIHGGIGVVLSVLKEIERHFRQWFKDVGDKERLAVDHAYALALDSRRYTYLTQEFDAGADLVKPPGDAWPELRPPWEAP